MSFVKSNRVKLRLVVLITIGHWVWIESCRVETGAEIPFDQLLEQESFIGDMLRLSESLLDDESLLSRVV